MTTLRDFHNRLRILRAIDLHELQDVGPFVGASHEASNEPWDEWVRFRDDPYRFFITCSDDTAAKIWQIVEKRSPPEHQSKQEATREAFLLAYQLLLKTRGTTGAEWGPLDAAFAALFGKPYTSLMASRWPNRIDHSLIASLVPAPMFKVTEALRVDDEAAP